MTSRLPRELAIAIAVGACALPLGAMAQSIGYGNVAGTDGAAARTGDAPDADAPAEKATDRDARRSRGGRGGGDYGIKVTPYIEAAQIVSAQLSPGDDMLTYSTIAAGVDASVQGRNTGLAASVRYEHRFGWGSRAEDGDIISGLANGYATLLPGLSIHAGALAARSEIDAEGRSVLSPLDTTGNTVTQIYSVYGGPTLKTHAGPFAVESNYRIGYSKVESPDAVFVAPDQRRADIFDDSLMHLADIHAGVSPGEILPVGIGAGARYYREDVSNLDQRIEDFSARFDVTLPITNTLAVVGGIGYEDVQVSSRDALRGPGGVPVAGPDGRFVTNESSPRVLAYDTSGLIWDAGVIWRPSRRTALEAHVGRRYGSTTYHGSFAYAPNPRSAVNVSVYDGITGFGGQLNQALIDLPTDFEVVRNPLTGGVGGCVSSLSGGGCLTGALGSVRSAVYRSRGVMASFTVNRSRLGAGIGAGYDRRKFIGAPGTVLAAINGTIEENYWLAGYVTRRLDEQSGIRADAYANWFRSGSSFDGDTTVVGATASYWRTLGRHLSAHAALGINGINREAPLTDAWIASALVGMRYTF